MLAFILHLAQLAPAPSPSGSTSPAPESVWQSPEVVAAYIIGAITLVGFIAGFITLRFQRRIERERAQFEDKLARARVDWEAERQRASDQEAEKERAEAARRRLAVAADDRERGALDYKQSLVRELKALKVLDMAKPLDLNALYVQVKIREDDSRRYVADEEIEALAAGHPAALLAATAERTVAKHTDAIQPEEALARYQHVVVLGDPGAGKTTMLKHLAFRMCHGEMSGPAGVPIFVELRRFIDSGMDDLLAFAVQDCDEKYGFVGAGEYVREKLQEGAAALLFDGLDEVLGGTDADQANDAYRKVAEEIARLCSRYPKAPVAVTCRRAGFNGGLDRFQVLEVLDFTWEQSRRFLENWFKGRDREYRDLLNSLNRNVRMKTLAANPLILSLIALVYENDLELPERRAELYNRCVEVLLKEWDSKRGIRRYSQFTTDRKRDLLEELAWHFHVQGRRYFPKSEVLEMIRLFLPTIGLDEADPEHVLKEIAANYGLLKEQATDWYGFWHLTVQEYFAAVWANEHFTESRGHLLHHRHDPWWEEVVLLLAGRMSDASDLLLGIAGVEDHDAPLSAPIVADDDVLQRDLLLLGECLLAAPRIRRAGLRSVIMESLWSALTTTEHDYVGQQVARVVTILGDQKWLALLRQCLVRGTFDRRSYQRPSMRTIVAETLGEYGEESYVTQVIDDLIQLDFLARESAAQMLRAAFGRRFRATRDLAVKGLEQVLDALPISADSGQSVKELLILLGEVDDELALSYARRFIPVAERAVQGNLGLGQYFAARVGAGCAHIAVKRRDASFMPFVLKRAKANEAILHSTEYLMAILVLSDGRDLDGVMREFVASSLYVTDEAGPRIEPLWTDALHEAALRQFVAMDELDWKLYRLLEAGSGSTGLIRAELDRSPEPPTHVRAALLALLARRGDADAMRDLKFSMSDWAMDPGINESIKEAMIHTLELGGLADFASRQVLAIIAGLDPRDDQDIARLGGYLRLVPSTKLDLALEDLWVLFEEYRPQLLKGGHSYVVSVLRALACRSSVGRIAALDFPNVFFDSVTSAGIQLRLALAPFVDSESIGAYVNFSKKFKTSSVFGDDEALVSVLVRNNYRLYPDGRLLPAVAS